MISPFRRFSARPDAAGLYDGQHEHDACGVAFVATMRGEPGHDIVEHALTALRNLDHRGAVGAEPDTGDGAGILTQVPDAFLREVVPTSTLPRPGAYAVGIAFLPDDDEEDARRGRAHRGASPPRRACAVLGWRDVPVTPGPRRRRPRAPVMPRLRQLFVASRRAGRVVAASALERMAFCLRKRAEREAGIYFPSLSARTLVYKGMLTTGQLEPFFPDLSDRRFATELALVHSRFSTNTFPSLAARAPVPAGRAQRRDQHRQGQPQLDARPRGQARQRPDPRRPRAAASRSARPDASDSATFDEVLELLHLGGRSLPHAVLMMIPEAWENHAEMDPARRAFYEFHSMFMEPWDGPASITFTDGTLIGAVLDRNGLRPSRYWVTDDGLVVLASEVGVLDLDPANVVQEGPAAAGPDVPRRHRPRPHRRRRGDQARARRAAPVRRVAARRPDPPGGPARARAHPAHAARRSPAASRPSATPRRSCASCSRRWPAPAPSRSARWAPTPRSRCCRAGRGCSSTTSPSSSPR